jgi:hypothetical protein
MTEKLNKGEPIIMQTGTETVFHFTAGDIERVERCGKLTENEDVAVLAYVLQVEEFF